jgi:Alpha/beta hydrolase domain
MIRRSIALVPLAAAAALVLPATAASAGSPKPGAPTVSGPVTGGQGFPSLLGTNIEPSSVGYVRDEYFLEGDATAYEPVGTLSTNGRWKLTEGERAPFKTRIVVYKPADPAAFSGTVLVEWLNVTAGFDNAVDWINTHNQIIRSGGAYVAVSAQAVGVQGGRRVLEGASAGGLKRGDPERYGTLTHPGDEYSYDIFTQAGIVASGASDTVNPFEGYDVQRVIATGESQSAFRITSYVNGVHPLRGVYDGFLIHSRGATAAGFDATRRGQDDATVPDAVRIRTDLDVPVFTFQTETDLLRLGSTPARQPDTKSLRLWEVAGTSHVDAYTGTIGITDTGDGAAELTLLDPAQASGGPLSCSQSVNAGAQFAALSAALAHLEDWVRDGTPPPKGARIETTGTGKNVAITRDEQGNAVGGVRTPLVDAPLATNTGEKNAGGRFCALFGTTDPFDAATLRALYPDGTVGWRDDFAKATEQAVQTGYWLEPEAEHFQAASEQISFG